MTVFQGNGSGVWLACVMTASLTSGASVAVADDDGLAVAYSNVPWNLPPSGSGYYIGVGYQDFFGGITNGSTAQPFMASASGKLETVGCYLGASFAVESLEVSVHERVAFDVLGPSLGKIEVYSDSMPFNAQQRYDLDFSSRDIELQAGKSYFLRFQTGLPAYAGDAYQLGVLLDSSTVQAENLWISPRIDSRTSYEPFVSASYDSVEVAAELVVASPSGLFDRRRTMTIEPLFDAMVDMAAAQPVVDVSPDRLVTQYVDAGSTTIDRRSFMEYDLSVLPWNAGIVGAKLDADVNLLTTDSTQGHALHYIAAYSGNGVAELTDAEYSGLAVARQIETSALGPVRYDLDLDNLFLGLGTGSILGLSTLGIYGQVGYDSTAYDDGPLLSIEYIPQTIPGDFNEDWELTIADLDMLRYNLGNPDYDLDGDGDSDLDDLTLLVESPNGFDALMGDANLDGSVNLLDLSMLASRFGRAGAWGWSDGNFNADFSVDLLDLSILASHFGQTTVPEPAGLLGLAVIGGVMRRR
ncbi:hypothetical protein [Mucisphaera calidilacus]|uniref:Dockerin domain-containing protein n=1 Tax=Mucisphaera calidilacus TaxID=2527982 RepID=A0A518BY55_9BACT|nr:hypothetical protein [Mucisphaera calidilacus]QDU71886.1 hypothetical protein Pan265_17440 [Mucisphaera calidilacus]